MVLPEMWTMVSPNARAGDDQTALVETMVHLDGRASQDPDEQPKSLTFKWSFVEVPEGSVLRSKHIQHLKNPRAWFIPDVPGDYTLQLNVHDGKARDTDTLLVTASGPNVSPNADADHWIYDHP